MKNISPLIMQWEIYHFEFVSHDNPNRVTGMLFFNCQHWSIHLIVYLFRNQFVMFVDRDHLCCVTQQCRSQIHCMVAEFWFTSVLHQFTPLRFKVLPTMKIPDSKVHYSSPHEQQSNMTAFQNFCYNIFVLCKSNTQ